MPEPEPTPEQEPRRLRGIANAFRSYLSWDSRENAWAVLNYLDARPILKRTILFGLPLLAVAGGLGAWGYARWSQMNSVRIARQWLDAGKLDQAAFAIQKAITAEPQLPVTWRLASELAWKEGQRAAAADYAKKAAVVGSFQAEDVIAWAEAAVLTGDTAQAEDAMSHLAPAAADASARALRVAGEIDRRARRFGAARDHFRAALDLDAGTSGRPPAIDEIPLGIACLELGSVEDRARGRGLLAKWAADPNWGVDALRALLADARIHRDRDETVRWAVALRQHPRCTLGDIPTCLGALAGADRARYEGMLKPLEERGRANPTEAAQLIGWLNEIGRSDDAFHWAQSLDAEEARKPPVAPGVAEALRALKRWPELRNWTERADWGAMDFMRWAYALAAARETGDEAKADQLWQTLSSDGHSSPAHALFAGDSLYAWGHPKEASELLWAAADRPDLALQALGTLARLYQVQRDAAGGYRAFSRLNEMRPDDRDIANNYAYFAALTDSGSQVRVARIAEGNYAHDPGNPAYRSTLAFVLVWTGQSQRALSLLEPVSRDWKKSPTLAFAYGAALAGAGRKAEAKQVFDAIDARTIGPRESEWIQAALR